MASRSQARRRVAMQFVGLGLASWLSTGQADDSINPLAGNCKVTLHNGTRWNPARPLISEASQVNDVLSVRGATLLMSYGIIPNDSNQRHELAIAVRLDPLGHTNAKGWVDTNVPGISMVISVDGNVLKSHVHPVVVAKYPLPEKAGSQTLPTLIQTIFRKELVLSEPPDRLPLGSGPLVVTGFGPKGSLTLYAVNVPKGMYSVGQHIYQMPSFRPPQACVAEIEPPYVGSGIMALGAGGSAVTMSNACEAGLTQTKEVQLGSHSIRDFPGQGATTEPRPFDITLNKCSIFAKPKISFAANHGVSQGKTVMNLDPRPDANGAPTARGIGIIMINDATKQRVEFGKQYDMGRAGADSAQFLLRASYLRTASSQAEVMGGHANGTAEFTIEFP